MSLPSKTQVVIVGAGPTGLSMAAQLIRYRIDFVIIEQHASTTELSKALVVHARTLEIFQQMQLADKAVSRGAINSGLNMFHNGEKKAHFDLEGLGNGLSPYPFALSLEQSKTETLLAEYIQSKEKIIYWNTSFVRSEQTSDAVKVFCKTADEKECVIDAEYIVGCDGASSAVRHEMGAKFGGDTLAKIFYVTDIKISSPVINANELYIFLIKKGFAIFFAMEGEGHYRIVGVLPGKREVSPDLKFGDIEETLKDQIGVPIVFEEVKWFSTYKIHSRKANTFQNGRRFIAGDAAHVHTPAGGQGMNTGIQDAYNLAWKIAMTLNSGMSKLVLNSYNTERIKNANHLLRTTDRMFDALAGTGWFWNFIRLSVIPKLGSFVSNIPAVKRQIFPLLSQIGIAYPGSTLTIRSKIGKIRSGSRMPYFMIQSEESIYDFLTQPVFKLLFYGWVSEVKVMDVISAKIPVSSYTFAKAPKSIFGKRNNFFILLRPDNYITYIGSDLNKVQNWLLRVFA